MLELTRPKPATVKNSSRSLTGRVNKNLAYLLMAAPMIVIVFMLSYVPMAGIIIAFKNYKFNTGIFGSEWVGFKNFEFLFNMQSDKTWQITRNTFLLNGLFIVTSLIVSLGLALLLNEVRNRKASRSYQTIYILPYFISWVTAGYLGSALLNSDGLINNLLVQYGAQPILWYNSPQYWPAILTISNIWKGVGLSTMIYLAGMIAINTDYYDAARIDGANGWQIATYITLPLILPLIIINTLLAIGRIFYADFGLFFYMTRDSSLLYSTTDVIDTYVFRGLRSLGDFGMTAAAGLYQSLLGFVLVVVVNRVVKRIDPNYGLF